MNSLCDIFNLDSHLFSKWTYLQRRQARFFFLKNYSLKCATELPSHNVPNVAEFQGTAERKNDSCPKKELCSPAEAATKGT